MAVSHYMNKDIKNTAEHMSSLRWLAMLPKNDKYEAPSAFWPSSKYSTIARQATLTKINLLSGHSWVSTGLVRRHLNKETTCPLCLDGIETLEHMLFECVKLKDVREDAQRRYRTKLIRKIPAVEHIITASRQQSLIIQHIYMTRIQREVLEKNWHIT